MVLSTYGRLVSAALLGAALASSAGCGGSVPTEVIGSVSGTSLTVDTAYWGGPFIVLSDADMSCQEVAWVDRIYDQGESPVDFDMVTMQVTFNTSDVAVGTYDVTGTAPISVKWLTTSAGAFNEERARTGFVEVEEITNKDHAIGNFELSFDDGDIEGTFDVEVCSNLKDR